jgi:hypothetical protein
MKIYRKNLSQMKRHRKNPYQPHQSIREVGKGQNNVQLHRELILLQIATNFIL